MSDFKQIFSEKKFPSSITKHKVFSKFKELKKVFPEIGLPNCEKEVQVDNTKESKASATNLINAIRQNIDERLRTINKYGVKKSDMGNKRKKKLEGCIAVLSGVAKQITNKNINKLIISNNGRITLNLQDDVVLDDKIIFKAGEGLFRVYNKLNDSLRNGHFLAMEKIENFQQFKDFSAKNVPSLKYLVRFSSDGSEGLWDIATMSMRGVSSCQSWGAGNATHLVGSMVDPFTGILYFTSGAKFNDYGSKMIRRCVVRFMVDDKKGKPFLALERMYPSMERAALDSFIAFIKERTDNKFEVIYLPESRKYSGVYVPMSKIVGTLEPHEQPYRDSAMPYKADANDVGGKIQEKVQFQLDDMAGSFAAKILTAARTMKISSIPEASKLAFRAIRGTEFNWDQSYLLYEALHSDIKKFFVSLDVNKYNSPNAYLRDIIESFMKNNIQNNIYKIIKVVSSKMPTHVGKLDDAVAMQMAKVGAEKVSAYLNGKLKKIKIVGDEKSLKNSDPAIPIYTKFLS